MIKIATLNILAFTVCILFFYSCNESPENAATSAEPGDSLPYQSPDTATIPNNTFGDMIRYGRELIVHSSRYLGPDGTAGKYLGNKMNCGNCHLDGGTRPYGLNFFSSHARYPQYRGRENSILTLSERINNCVERPQNGTPLPLDSKEMIAMVSYMMWLSQNVPVGQRVPGDDGITLAYPNRPANPEKGARLYATHCSSCHGADGQGVLNSDTTEYTYPPLWGPHSYQAGSSMHRVLKAARFIKANMPDKLATWDKPVLTDEEAIDVAAFINNDSIHTRPGKEGALAQDYPYVDAKPIDFGVGPYRDTFPEIMHKYGPFKPIIEYHEQHNIPVVF